MDMSQLIREFVAEAQELVVSAEEDVLALEHAGVPEREEILNRLFRVLHTIKGGAACVDFDAVTDFAHAMEDVTELLRKGSLEPSPAISLALLEGVDKLKSGILSGNGSIDDPGPVVARLREISHPSGAKASAGAVPTKGVGAGRTAFDLKRHDLESAKADGMHVYDIELDVAGECARHSHTPFGLIRHLGSIGNVLATRPDGDLFLKRGQDLSDCSVLLATIIDDPEILFAGLEIAPLSFTRYAPGDLPNPTAEPVSPVPTPTPTPEPTSAPTKAAAAPRSPEKTLRIPVEVADSLMNLAGELVVVRNRAQQLQADGSAHEISALYQRLDVVTSDLQRMVMRTRMQPVGNVFGRFTRVVRDLCRTLGKEIEVEIVGAEVELDKSLIDGLVEPLTHLVRNSVDHGIEPPEERRCQGKPAVGRIHLAAEHMAGMVNITVTDDGKGIDPVRLRQAAVEKGLMPRAQAEGLNDREALGLIFLPGFSTAKEITELSGRGVGMDAVKAALQRLGGVVEIESEIGKGSVLSIKLPLTLAIIPAIVLGAGDQHFAIPQVNVLEVVWLHGDQVWQSVQRINQSEVYWLRGRMLPLIRLSKVLGLPRHFADPETGEERSDRRDDAPDRRGSAEGEVDERRTGMRDRRISPENSLYIVVLRVGSDRFGLCVERIVDTEEVVVKPLHERLKESEVYAGVTVLGDGTTAMILDIPELARVGGLRWETTDLQADEARKGGGEPQKMLVFESSAERFTVPLSLLLRVDEIAPSDIQTVAGREVLRFRDSVIPLLRLEAAIPGLRPVADAQGIHVIIPRIGKLVAIVATRIVDIVEVLNDVLVPGADHPAILGTQVIDGHATSLLDLCVLSASVDSSLPAGGKASRGRLLVVEDSRLYATLIAALFRGIGFDVVAAANGGEALVILGDRSFDGVVSDVEMPGMDGLELARQVRMDPSCKGLPLLGMSMLEEKVMRSRALSAGFDDFCQKNNLARLAERVEALLSPSFARSSHG